MKQFLIIFTLCLIMACSGSQTKHQNFKFNYFEIEDYLSTDTLFRVPTNEYELGADFCYVNQKGDTIIPYGRFTHSFSDTILTYGIVTEKIGDQLELLGINQKGQRLYEVHWFDNGPDYIEEGLFRILRNGKIGFADTTGKVIIEPEYDCAFQFSNGKAKVSYNCELEKDLDHTVLKSDNWIYINKNGEKVN